MKMEKGGISTLGEPMPELFKSGFDRFWDVWPKSPRKGAKSECRKKWDKFLCEHCADQIIKHVEWMKTTDQWRQANGAYIPAPLVYLNQQRWDGAEIPEQKPNVDPSLQKIIEDDKKSVPIPNHIREKLKQLRKEISEHNKVEKQSLDQILQWKWMVAGGIIVLSWLISHIKLDTITRLVN